MKTRASKRKNPLNYPPLAEYRMRANPAHDMLRVVDWTARAKDDDFHKVYSAHVRPLIALIFACSGIEGYVNYVGQTMNSDWLAFSKGAQPGQKGRPGIKDKLKRVYQLMGKEAPLGTGILQQVIELFEKRGYLMHPTLDERTFVGEAPPADILEMIGDDYAPGKVWALAEAFRKKLLADSKVRDLSWSLGYAQKINVE